MHTLLHSLGLKPASLPESLSQMHVSFSSGKAYLLVCFLLHVFLSLEMKGRVAASADNQLPEDRCSGI